MEFSLKDVILQAREPLVFKKYFKHDIVQWTLQDWGKILQQEELLFREGKNEFTWEPQFERTTPLKKGFFKDFYEVSLKVSSEQQWLYFDYKQLNNWFKNVEEIQQLKISLDNFGFPEVTINEFVLWMGTKGAHTPCHYDSYGFNLVFQILGKKQWLLFPNNEDLQATRVPYEESSIYSKLNFFSPQKEQFSKVKNARLIVLEPGDVLLVPHKWWHYVENLETAISMNVWLPLPEDHQRRLEESLVQLLIKELTKNLPDNTRKLIFNPDMHEAQEELTLQELFDQILLCKSLLLKQETSLLCQKQFDYSKLNFVETIAILTEEKFMSFLNNQRQRFGAQSKNNINNSCEISNLLECITSPDVIELICKKIIK